MDKFWSKVAMTEDNRDCWLWIAKSRYNSGYGCIRINKTLYGAHRVAYMLAYGDIPENYVVMHRCDNKLCVNPLHLIVGSQKDNVQDCIAKGRLTKRGPSIFCHSGLHKLSETKGANGACKPCRNAKLKEARKSNRA